MNKGFHKLVGHERAMQLLRATMAGGRLPHALLITGPAGVGKTTLAMYIAQAVNCETAGPGEDPCGVCRSCAKISRGTHPDVVRLEPEGRKRIIRISHVRELGVRISYRAYEGRVKVFLVREADRMEEEAANAMLKTLEEPPPDSMIILTAPEATDLLPTIASRCSRIGLAPLALNTVENWLESERGLSGPRAKFLALLSGGCLGRVVELDPEAVWEKRREILERLASLHREHPALALDWAAETAKAWTERRKELEKLAEADEGDGDEAGTWIEDSALDKDNKAGFFSLLRFWYRDIMVAACGGTKQLLVNTDQIEALSRAAARAPVSAFLTALDEIDQAETALERMARPELVLENLFFKLTAIQGGKS